MPALEPLDLRHLGHERVIGCYLLETTGGPALFDCGPSTCVPELKGRLRERGLELQDLRHLLLSHIHLDHAGAAGVLVHENPDLQVHVSAIGAPHLVDPSRLEHSARRLYEDEFDTLWGELAPVPAPNVHEVGEKPHTVVESVGRGHYARVRPFPSGSSSRQDRVPVPPCKREGPPCRRRSHSGHGCSLPQEAPVLSARIESRPHL